LPIIKFIYLLYVLTNCTNQRSCLKLVLYIFTINLLLIINQRKTIIYQFLVFMKILLRLIIDAAFLNFMPF